MTIRATFTCVECVLVAWSATIRMMNETMTPMTTVVQQIGRHPLREMLCPPCRLAHVLQRPHRSGRVGAREVRFVHRMRRARLLTHDEHRTRRSERSVFGICQPNPSCRSSLRRNCCAVLLTASERYMQSSASERACRDDERNRLRRQHANARARQEAEDLCSEACAPPSLRAMIERLRQSIRRQRVVRPESAAAMLVTRRCAPSNRLCSQSSWNCEPKIFCHSDDASKPLSAYSYSHALSARL